MDTNYSLAQQNIGASLLKSDVTMTFSHCNLMFAVSCRLSHVLHRQVSRCSTDLLMTKNGRVCKNVLYDTVLFRFSDKYSFFKIEKSAKVGLFRVMFHFCLICMYYCPFFDRMNGFPAPYVSPYYMFCSSLFCLHCSRPHAISFARG